MADRARAAKKLKRESSVRQASPGMTMHFNDATLSEAAAREV
jgi:hypothetical protein